VGCGAKPHYPKSALQRVNSKTVQWTVFEEGTLCKRERSLMTSTEHDPWSNNIKKTLDIPGKA
jgi:hypothetical protein